MSDTSGMPKSARRPRLRGKPRVPRTLGAKLVAGTLGTVMAGGVAFAATNWIVGFTAGSNSGQGKSATVSNLTIAAVASPAPSSLLYPGGTGDVVATITNNNAFPVTITAVDLPTNATYANGYSDSALGTAQPGCSSTTSLVGWAFATSTSGSAHSLTSPLTVAANGTLTVTFTADATMASTAPAACESTYFAMPALTGIAASGGAATATTSPATDSWTS